MNIKWRKLIKGMIISTLCVFTITMSLSACSSGENTSDDNDVEKVELSSGESLKIDTADITEQASFYLVDIDGTEMGIIAVKDSSGEIRTAFNTCQVCYSSGRGYYKQVGDLLVCQNCRNSFTADDVEVESGGCNPVPIFEENKTVNDDVIEISYDYLNKGKQIFSNWQTQFY